MDVRSKIAIPLITGAALIGTGGIAYASTSTIPTPTPTPTITQPTTPPIPPPFRRCNVQFDRIRLAFPVVNPITGLPARVGQWDRVCVSRIRGVTVTPLSRPIVF